VKSGVDPDAHHEAGEDEAEEDAQPADHEPSDGDAAALQGALAGRDPAPGGPAEHDADDGQGQHGRKNQAAE
jgi:hypothetical protein